MRRCAMLLGGSLAITACSIAVPGADFDSAPAGSPLDTGAVGDDDDDGEPEDTDGSTGATDDLGDGTEEGGLDATGAVDDGGSTGTPGGASGPASGGGSGPSSASGPGSGSGPSGSGGSAPPTPPSEPEDFCGDGSIDPGEVCDLFDLDGEDCESLGYGPGVLTCQANCGDFNTAGCSTLPACGDNHADPGEQCDGLDMDGENCSSLGFDIGVLQCHDDCTYDTSTCANL